MPPAEMTPEDWDAFFRRLAAWAEKDAADLADDELRDRLMNGPRKLSRPDADREITAAHLATERLAKLVEDAQIAFARVLDTLDPEDTTSVVLAAQIGIRHFGWTPSEEFVDALEHRIKAQHGGRLPRRSRKKPADVGVMSDRRWLRHLSAEFGLDLA